MSDFECHACYDSTERRKETREAMALAALDRLENAYKEKKDKG